MDPAQTAATYDKIAPHWATGNFNLQNGIRQHERALKFAPKTGAALDVGCGASGRILNLLLSHGFTAEGLDLSPVMLSLAKTRHPEVTFHQADICAWEFPRAYGFISAWDSVWHVPLAQQPAVITKLCAGLARGGVLIFSSGAVDVPGEVTNPCHGEPLYHAAPGISPLLRLVDAAGCACRHLEYDQFPEPHLCLIVQKT